MADADRTQRQHLTMLAGVAETPKLYGVFPVLRAAEARAHGMPRIGHAKRPEMNLVDLTHEPTMGFARKRHPDHAFGECRNTANDHFLFDHCYGETGMGGFQRGG